MVAQLNIEEITKTETDFSFAKLITRLEYLSRIYRGQGRHL